MNDRMTWRPTARLRFVERPLAEYGEEHRGARILQQWWGPELPSYMRDDSVGEWRDIPMGVESP
jgi:hypothetical protein